MGVVTSDLGIPGVNYGACDAYGGDDGKLQQWPHGDDCRPAYPQFLSFGAQTDAARFSSDAACIAAVGSDGCVFQEQLEAPLKALWPRKFLDRQGHVVTPNPYNFISVTQEGTLGRGDLPADQGGNDGFLRNDPQNPSLIAIVVLTNKDDCSVLSTEHLRLGDQAQDGSRYKDQAPNLRCYYNPTLSFSVKERYYDGFRKLRQGYEDRVVFTAIAGVPADLVTPDALSNAGDDDSPSAFYDGILDDERMLERPVSEDYRTGALQPSCSRTAEADPAYPPRRLVHLARAFGAHSTVQSICQKDLTSAMDAIAALIGRHFAGD